MLKNLAAASILLAAGVACGVTLVAWGGPHGSEDAPDESEATRERGGEGEAALDEFIVEEPENTEPPPKNEAAVWEAYLKTLEEHFRHVKALHDAGRRGGDARQLAWVSYELASARAALARARGDEAEARKWLDQGMLRARRFLAYTQVEFEAGLENQQDLLDATRVYRDASLAALRARRKP